MITDAFLEAGGYARGVVQWRRTHWYGADVAWGRKLSNCIDDPREFQNMTDCILKVPWCNQHMVFCSQRTTPVLDN